MLPILRASLLLASGFLCACASVPAKTDSRELLLRLRRNAELRKAVSGTLSFTQKAGGKTVSAPAVLLVEWPDRLRFELQDPTGSVLAVMVLSGRRFWIYRHDRPDILTGPIEKLPAENLAVGVSVADIVRVFLARPPVEHIPAEAVSEGSAAFPLGRSEELVRWDPRTLEPLQWVEKRPDGTATTVDYGEWTFRDGAHYPGQLTVTQPARQFLLSWREWEASVPQEKKLFQIPQQQTFGRKIKALP